MVHTNDRCKALSLYVRDIANMLESDEFGVRDKNIYSCSVNIGGSSSVDIVYDFGLRTVEMFFSNGYSVSLHKRDNNTYTASICCGIDKAENIMVRDSTDIEYIIFMYLLYKAYVGVCDLCGEDDGNYVLEFDCVDALHFDDMFCHSICSLHKYFLTFINHKEVEEYKIVVKNGHSVFTFDDAIYGSFIVEYVPYTLGGEKKDLIVFRYHEFDKLYFYYDVLKKDYVIEKNDRIVRIDNLGVIVRDLKYIMGKVNDLSSICGSENTMHLTYSQLSGTLFRMIYSVLL